MLEAEHVGFGASGRNGGWVSSLWPVSPDTIARRHGRTAALAQLAALRDTVDEVGRVDAAEGLGAQFAKGGALLVARTPGQAARARAEVAHGAAWDDGTVWLDAAASPGAPRRRRGARRDVHAALRPDPPAPARRRPGRDRAPAGRAGGRGHPGGAGRRRGRRARGRPPGHGRRGRAWPPRAGPASLPGHARSVAPGLLAHGRHRATHRRAVGAGRARRAARCSPTTGTSSIYGQRTDDGRIAFGGRGAPYHWGSAIRPEFDEEERVFDALRGTLLDLLPQLHGIRFTHAWGGPLGIARDWHPSVTWDPVTRTGRAGGYVGDGVAAANLAGRTLADLLLDRRTPLTELPWVGHRSPRWEPEPLRWLGVNAGLRARGARRPRGVGDRPSGPARRPGGAADRRTRFGRVREIESLPDLDVVLSDGRALRGLRLQDLDLGGHEERPALPRRRRGHGRPRRTDDRRARDPPARAGRPRLPHGCRRAGQPVPGEPVPAPRAVPGLREHGYEATPDARAYHWARDGAVQHDAFVTLLRAVHDDSITDALDEVLAGVPVVGVMGGHALERERRRIPMPPCSGTRLAATGLTVVTGGGPGAMEAANLGAFAPDRRRPRPTPSSGCAPSPASGRRSSRGPTWRWPSTTSSSGCRCRRPGAQRRHPHVVLRARAAERLLQRDRQVLLQRHPRGRAARPLLGGSRRPRGRGRHRAGGLPGGDPALLRGGGQPCCPWSCSWTAHWTDTIPVWAALAALATDAPWPAGSTSSTPSRRRRAVCDHRG